jgi:uncharacterized repeat protein (TIGR03803 family)
MKSQVAFALLFGLCLGPTVYAANPRPVPVYTFICKGTLASGATCSNGGRPNTMLQGSDGAFYGTAWDSQEGDSQPHGGTIFSLTPSGTFTVLHRFLPGPNKNFPSGNNPFALAEGSDGMLYGATVGGGSAGGGVLFRIGTSGSGFQILHNFCSSPNCVDGGPGAMVLGKDGNLYGASYGGGEDGPNGYGTIFRVVPSSGAYTVLFSFGDQLCDCGPTGLTVGPNGTLYGMQGNALFHFNPSNGDFQSALLPFPIENQFPSDPTTGLIVGPNGNLYGLYTIYPQLGTGVFEVAPDGTNFQIFPEYDTGVASLSVLLFATDGNFWVASFNGTDGYGNIVKVSPADGTLVGTAMQFSGTDAVGSNPQVLIQSKDGAFWGMTESNGEATNGFLADGVIFGLNAGLPPR